MNLLIDIGNTYSKFKYDNKDVIRIETKLITSKNYLLNYFKDFNEPIFRCAISSVVIGLDKIVSSYIIEKYNITPLIINKYLKTNIKYPKVENNELGSDLISLMEACSKEKETFISISVGTATVINFVLNNTFMGCAIYPGLITSFNGLINSASLIEDTVLKGDYSLLGMNTTEALKAGVFNEFVFSIERFYQEIELKYNLSNTPLYITGGFINELKNNLKINATYDPDLIFKGIKLLMDKNYE